MKKAGMIKKGKGEDLSKVGYKSIHFGLHSV